MNKKLLSALATTIFSTCICLAQSSGSQSMSSWGDPVFGVQLSIESSNEVFIADSTNIVNAQIKNSSTNLINLVELNPMTDTALFLTNNFGKNYRLTPDYHRSPGQYISISANPYPFNHMLDAGETYKFSVPVVIGTNIDVGSYQLKAVRYFVIGKNRMGSHKLESNLLEVQIK